MGILILISVKAKRVGKCWKYFRLIIVVYCWEIKWVQYSRNTENIENTKNIENEQINEEKVFESIKKLEIEEDEDQSE